MKYEANEETTVAMKLLQTPVLQVKIITDNLKMKAQWHVNRSRHYLYWKLHQNNETKGIPPQPRA